MDNFDIRREADKEARNVSSKTFVPIKYIREADEDFILSYYQIACDYYGVPTGKEKEWIEGWRKGYGVLGNY